MYMDKLDGRIAQEFFDKHSAAWRSKQDGLQRKIQDTKKATPAPIDQAVDMLRLTSRASELFVQARHRAAPVAPNSSGRGRLAGWGIADDPVRTFRNFAPLEPGKL